MPHTSLYGQLKKYIPELNFFLTSYYYASIITIDLVALLIKEYNMFKKDTLTPVEWEIMEAIWELRGARSIREVLEHAFPNGEKAYTTVQTIMNTLQKKGLLTRRKTGLVHFYTPSHTRDELIRIEMSSLLSRKFDGSIPELANSLLSLDSLSLKEIEQIKLLLKEKEDELKGDRS